MLKIAFGPGTFVNARIAKLSGFNPRGLDRPSKAFTRSDNKAVLAIYKQALQEIFDDKWREIIRADMLRSVKQRMGKNPLVSNSSDGKLQDAIQKSKIRMAIKGDTTAQISVALSGVPYALILDVGTKGKGGSKPDIKPKGGKQWLTVPNYYGGAFVGADGEPTPWAKAVTTMRGGKGTAYRKTFPIYHQDSGVIMTTGRYGMQPIPVWYLKKTLEIRPTYWFSRFTFRTFSPTVPNLLADKMEEILSR